MRVTLFFVGIALPFAMGSAQAQTLTCSPNALGLRACQVDTTCTCEYSAGGSMTGKLPGYFWNCSILAAQCTAAPGVSLLNSPGSAGAKETSKSGQPSARQLQAALKARGFDPGAIDGKMGKRTRRAVEAWQASVGVPVTGKITVEQWRNLQF